MRRVRTEKVTIKDIAQMCGVSMQTVSRVINQRPDVSEETRRAVTETIARVGYHPSALARGLVQQRSYTLGFVTSGLKYVGIAQTLTGIAEQCEAKGFGLLVKDLPESAEDHVLSTIEFFISRQVEGILVLLPGLDVPTFLTDDRLPPTCPPLVLLKSATDERFTTLAIDNVGGARMATRHLIESGRRSIAHIAGPEAWLESRQRTEGWRAELAAAGITVDEATHLRRADWTSQGGAAAAADLLESSPGLDAVFAANDQMAFGAISFFHRHGIEIPGQIAVIGFDGVDEGEHFIPPLSTVRQPMREMGVAAVTQLLDLVDHPGSSRTIEHLILDVELVVRESTVAAA